MRVVISPLQVLLLLFTSASGASSQGVFPGSMAGSSSHQARDLQADVSGSVTATGRQSEGVFPVAYLSNRQGESNTGTSDDVELMIDVISKYQLNGDGPQYETHYVPSDGPSTVETVKALYADGMRIFVGPETSNQAKAIADWAEVSAPDAVFFSFSATNPDLGERPNIIQLMPTDLAMARQIVGFLTLSDRTYVSIIQNDGVYATGLARYIRNLLPLAKGESCVLKEFQATPEELQDCVQRVATSTPQDDTLVVLLTSGLDTRETLRAAFQVYSSDNAAGVLWLGADTVAFDTTLYNKDDPDVWKAARMVDLHAIEAGRSSPQADDQLATHFWSDFLTFQDCDTKVLTTDTDPAVLLAADAISLIFLNAGGALTGAGADLEVLRISLLRQSPFLSLQSGPVRFNNKLQRIDMRFQTVRVQRMEQPVYGLWKTVSIVAEVQSARRRGALNIIPPQAMFPGKGQRDLLVDMPEEMKEIDEMEIPAVTPATGFDDFIETGRPQSENEGIQEPCYVDCPIVAPMIISNLGMSVDPLFLNPRRLVDEESVSKLWLYRQVVGAPSEAFRPSRIASCNCYRQIETTINSKQDDVDLSFCQPAHNGFILSAVDASVGATFSDVMTCNGGEMIRIGRSVLEAVDATVAQSNMTDIPRQDCGSMSIKFGEAVGQQALWDETLCSVGEGSKSIGEAYQSVDSSIFVASGVAKPLLNVPGLVQTFLEQVESPEATSLENLPVLDAPYHHHVRGEDWECACGAIGAPVTCNQMYDLIQCPVEAGNLAECCSPPRETIGCSSIEHCQEAIEAHTAKRSVALKILGQKIAIHPREAFEGFLSLEADAPLGTLAVTVCQQDVLTTLVKVDDSSNANSANNNEGTQESPSTGTQQSPSSGGSSTCVASVVAMVLVAVPAVAFAVM